VCVCVYYSLFGYYILLSLVLQNAVAPKIMDKL